MPGFIVKKAQEETVVSKSWLVFSPLLISFIIVSIVNNMKKDICQDVYHFDERTGVPCIDVSDIFPDLKTVKVPKEIEIKIKLEEQQLKEFREKLELMIVEKKAKKKVVCQKDSYFNNPKKTFFFRTQGKDEKYFWDILRTVRIRECPGKNSINTKLRHIDERGKTLSRDEYEKRLENPELHGSLKLLKQKGYECKVVIEKTRTKYLVDDFEVAIDHLEKGVKGRFVEVELKKEDVSVEDGMAMIHSFLKEMGIATCTWFDRSYLHMAVNPTYDFGEPIDLSFT